MKKLRAIFELLMADEWQMYVHTKTSSLERERNFGNITDPERVKHIAMLLFKWWNDNNINCQG